MSAVRVRFAPSPTGPLHLGGVRTALYNYLFARQHGGTFILRIEDTDQKRFVPGAEAYIMDALRWCGILPDEGPVSGGSVGPYRQSERSALYQPFIRQLLEQGSAYYAFDTPEELETLRLQAPAHDPFQYNAITRTSLCNSLSLSAEEVEHRLTSKEPYVIRIRVPDNEHILFHDLIRGEVSVSSSHLDDKVLFKSDGLPTYHFANVVDDHLMHISHVIRGEEWLPSAPLHLLLYRFLGWESSMPAFAHLPLILKPDGNGKLSKRDGDRLGFPVFPLIWKDPLTGETSSGYRESGYLPEAFINMLAFLGWNPGHEQEILSLEALISQFSIDRIIRSGARFDPEKARWFNHQHIQLASVTDLSRQLIRYMQESGNPLASEALSHDSIFTSEVLSLIRDRTTVLSDLWEASSFFFQAPSCYSPDALKKVWNPSTRGLMERFATNLLALTEWNKSIFQDAVSRFSTEEQIKTGQLMNPLRLLIVGSNHGPGMADIAALLGQQQFCARIGEGLEKITDPS